MIGAVALLLGMLLMAACGGGQAAPADNSRVTPLTGPEGEGSMTIKLPDGTLPCGVFNVNGFGDKTAVLADFPGCTAPNYRVRCLDANAQWIGDNITNVFLSEDKTQVTFTSQQEGTCGLFPAQ
jgi:hypothetical protein